MTFLIDNPNRNFKQYGYPRRGGGFTAPQITLHTYEAPYTRSLLAAATWLTQRTTPGSYHALVGDASPRDVLQLAPWSYETWHCTQNNNWAIGISAVTYAHAWKSIPAKSAENMAKSMAFAAANAADWLEKHHGRIVEPRLLTRAQAMRKMSGFVHHGTMDPGRRSDAGRDFPWDIFIAEFKRLRKGGAPKPAPTPTPWEEFLSMFKNKADFQRFLDDRLDEANRRDRAVQNRQLNEAWLRDMEAERAKVAQAARQLILGDVHHKGPGSDTRGLLVEGFNDDQLIKAMLANLTGAVVAIASGEEFDLDKLREGVTSDLAAEEEGSDGNA